MHEKPIKAFHFLQLDGCLGYDDGRKVVVGHWMTANSAPVLCYGGMHASEKVLDALKHAPGLICCRVEVRGSVQHEHDKLVGRQRRVLSKVDAREAVVEFAQWCATRAKKHAADAASAARCATYAASAAAYAATAARCAIYAANAAVNAAADAAADAADAAAAYAKERALQEKKLRSLLKAAGLKI